MWNTMIINTPISMPPDMKEIIDLKEIYICHNHKAMLFKALTDAA